MLNLSIFQNKKISEWLLYSAVFALPFQVFLVLYTPDWGMGFSNPYLNVNLYLFEILTLLSLFFSALNGDLKLKLSSRGKVLLGFLSLSFLVSIWLPDIEFIGKILFTLKYASFLAFYFLVSTRQVSTKRLIAVFLTSALLQAVIGILQFVWNQDLGLKILGEPALNLEIPHVASFFDSERIRAYGTFSHPNVLAFFLSFAFGLSTLFIKKWTKYEYLLTAVLALGVIAAFSRTGIMIMCALVSFVVIDCFKSKWKWSVLPGPVFGASLLFILRPISLNDASVQERIFGIQESLLMWLDSPFWGQGFRQYTDVMTSFSERVLMPWDFQPVHNVFLLSFSELGLLTSLVLLVIGVLFAKKIWANKQLLILALIPVLFACFEHFFLSLDQGIYLGIFVLVLIKRVAEMKGNLNFRLENLWKS